MNHLITKLDIDEAFSILQKSKMVFYCGPGITNELGAMLYKLSQQDITLFIVCDLDAQNDYRGLNEIEELNRLFNLGNVKVKTSKGINVSFISNLSEYNYFLFPVSKILKVSPVGYNAVLFNGLTASILFAQFFAEVVTEKPDEFLRITELQKEREINQLTDKEDTIDVFIDDSIDSELITMAEIQKIQKKVKEFPPEKPDLLRKVNFINTYIQVVDLKFEGANWQSRRVSIPQKLIPFKSDVLKKNLDSKLKIFSADDENKSLKDFNELKNKVEALRKEFLFRSKLRKKSIIKLNEKGEFKKKIDSLQTEVQAFKESLFKLVKGQIDISRERIKKELIDFYKENPEEYMKKYIGNFDEMISDEVNNMMRDIKFPTVNEIVGELELTYYYLNFTFEDFEDAKFLEELAGWEKLSREEFFMLFDKQKGFQTLK